VRILMLGNSFTYYNDMPKMLAAHLNDEVLAHTRGGAYLDEQYDPTTPMGGNTLEKLATESWDYVILQEQSLAPVTQKERFLTNIKTLCELARKAGATPVLYATWAYQKGSEKLASTGMSYEEMADALWASYRQAAEENNALIAPVGNTFQMLSPLLDLYMPDGFHPTLTGSDLAAKTLAGVIQKDKSTRHAAN